MATGRVLRSVVAKFRAGVGLVPSRAVCDFAPLPRHQWSPNLEFRSARLGFSSFADSSWYREDEGDDQSVDAFQQHLADQVVQAHAPDWLPLVPGSAYWIHRSSLGVGGSSTERRAELEAELRRAGNIVNMSDEEKMATWTPTGWPAEHSVSRAMSPEVEPEGQMAERDPPISVPLQAATKRTFQPHVIRRKRKHGFFARKMTVGGRRVLARRFAKGRRKLSA